MTKQEAMKTIMQCLQVLYGTDVTNSAPAAPRQTDSANVSGWQLAKIAAVSEKEVQTKRGPVMKLGLCFKINGAPNDVWASTFDDAIRRDAARFSKGDLVEVFLEQKGEFWNFKQIREPNTKPVGIQASEIPF
jgi:hypothetical protein